MFFLLLFLTICAAQSTELKEKDHTTGERKEKSYKKGEWEDKNGGGTETLQVDFAPPAELSIKVLSELQRQAEKVLKDDSNVDDETVFSEESVKHWVQINPDIAELTEDTSLVFQMHNIWTKFANISCGEEFVAKRTCVTEMYQLKEFIDNENPIGNDYSDYSDYSVKEDFCSRLEASCPDDKFPSIDGWCNNKQHPEWGSTNQPYSRLIGKSFYKDGFFQPWSENDGFPSPREISQTFMTDPKGETLNDELSILFMQWGQFIAHDITQAAVQPGKVDEKCRSPNCIATQGSIFDIKVGRKTFQFISSKKGSRDPCHKNDGPIQSEQVNGYSSYIHATTVYRRNLEGTAKLLRKEEHSGKLDSFFPAKKQSTKHCGDPRCTVTPVLYTLHGLFLKEHNRLVDKLREEGMNDPELLFNMARQIVIAEIQAITYRQWLPLVVGQEIMKKYKLNIESDSGSEYDPSTDATLFNEFVTAAFRFGHSLIAGNVNSKLPMSHKLQETFFSRQYFQ